MIQDIETNSNGKADRSIYTLQSLQQSQCPLKDGGKSFIFNKTEN